MEIPKLFCFTQKLQINFMFHLLQDDGIKKKFCFVRHDEESVVHNKRFKWSHPEKREVLIFCQSETRRKLFILSKFFSFYFVCDFNGKSVCLNNLWFWTECRRVGFTWNSQNNAFTSNAHKIIVFIVWACQRSQCVIHLLTKSPQSKRERLKGGWREMHLIDKLFVPLSAFKSRYITCMLWFPLLSI